MFRNASDRLPVALILAASAVDIAAYSLINNVWVLVAYWLAFALPKGLICAWGHHHQHVHTFRHPALNRIYEIFLAFHTGITTNLWVLHHNLGHHLNFLDQSKDQSAWKRRDGTRMGVAEYTLMITVTSFYRAYLVGKKHRKHQSAYLIWTAITFALLGLLVWFRPLPGLFIFALPGLTSLTFTSWATYDHHAGLDTQNSAEASYNIMSPLFNLLTGNLGYHTAHHHRQAVHWSQLPALHATIAHKIPAHLYVQPFFFPSERTASPDRTSHVGTASLRCAADE